MIVIINKCYDDKIKKNLKIKWYMLCASLSIINIQHQNVNDFLLFCFFVCKLRHRWINSKALLSGMVPGTCVLSHEMFLICYNDHIFFFEHFCQAFGC